MTRCVADTEEEKAVVGFGQRQSLRTPQLPRHRVVHVGSNLPNNQHLSLNPTKSNAHIRASALAEPVGETKLVALVRTIRSTGRHYKILCCGGNSA